MFANILRNWFTSVLGGIVGIPEIIAGIQAGDVVMILKGLAMFLMGLAAKDSNVSGK